MFIMGMGSPLLYDSVRTPPATAPPTNAATTPLFIDSPLKSRTTVSPSLSTVAPSHSSSSDLSIS